MPSKEQRMKRLEARFHSERRILHPRNLKQLAIITATDYIGPIMTLCLGKRGELVRQNYVSGNPTLSASFFSTSLSL